MEECEGGNHKASSGAAALCKMVHLQTFATHLHVPPGCGSIEETRISSCFVLSSHVGHPAGVAYLQSGCEHWRHVWIV